MQPVKRSVKYRVQVAQVAQAAQVAQVAQAAQAAQAAVPSPPGAALPPWSFARTARLGGLQ
jgi:hypothetical protein